MPKNIRVINNTDNKVGVKINDVNEVVTTVMPPRGTELRTLNPGAVFKKNGIEYIVCEQFADDTTAVVRKNLLEQEMKFGDNNNWKESLWRKYLNTEYLKEIENDFGADKIVEHDVDLTSFDGYDDYGVTIDKVSIMNLDRYRKYHKYIGDTKEFHYLSTPDSTPSGYSPFRVLCVDGYGNVGCCDWCVNVRPFFILKSNVLVEEEANT